MHSSTLTILEVALLGLFTTSSVMLGAATGLYLPIPVRKISHERALANLLTPGINRALWVQAARESVESVSRAEEYRLLQEARSSRGAGLAIILPTRS